jgi:hypothetical protein
VSDAALLADHTVLSVESVNQREITCRHCEGRFRVVLPTKGDQESLAAVFARSGRLEAAQPGEITQTSRESSPQKLGRDLKCEHGTAVVCDRNVRIDLGVMRKRDALQDSLPAIGGVERGKRSDELIEKRRLGFQKLSSWFGLW